MKLQNWCGCALHAIIGELAKGKFLNLVSLNIKIIVHETHHKSRIFFVHLRFKISRFKNLPLDSPPINKYVNCIISGMI